MDVNINELNMCVNQWLLKHIQKFVQRKIMILCNIVFYFDLILFFSLYSDIYFSRQFFTLDEDQRENLRRERRRLQEQLRRVRRQDRLQQRNSTLPINTTVDHHSPSSHSTNLSPTRHLHLQLNHNELSLSKLPIDVDLSTKNDINGTDENQLDLIMDSNQHMTSTNPLISTSMDNLNSNIQPGYPRYSISTLSVEDGHENNEINSQTTLSTNSSELSIAVKRKKKSEKDFKSVKIRKSKRKRFL